MLDIIIITYIIQDNSMFEQMNKFRTVHNNLTIHPKHKYQAYSIFKLLRFFQRTQCLFG